MKNWHYLDKHTEIHPHYENDRQFTKQRTNEIKAFFMGSLLSEMRIDIILYFHRINN